MQVGVGLMVLQQFGGVNGIAYYASAIFVSAGELTLIVNVFTKENMDILGAFLVYYSLHPINDD